MARCSKRFLASPESLEFRRVLAGVVEFTDVDGDLVRVSSTRGTDRQLAAAIRFIDPPGGAAAGSRIVDSLDLSQPLFSGTSLSIAVRKRQGDGSVEIGGITTGSGGVAALRVEGGFASLIAHGNVGRIVVRGSLRAGSTIRADGRIAEIAISGAIEGTTSAPVVIAARGDGNVVALGSLHVGGDCSYGRILAGYDTGLRPVNGAAQIKKVAIDGMVLGTDIVAGITNPDGGLAFGDATDRAIDTGNRSRIGSVRLGRVAATQDSADAYGIVANAIGTVHVGGARVQMPADWQSQAVGTSDLVISDIAPTATPYTDFIAAAIRAMESRTGSDTSEGILWNVTDGNALPGMGTADAPWVISTQDAWGQTGVPDLTRVQNHMIDTIREIVAGAETVVDISGLAPLPSGRFRQAIIDGAREADQAGRRPVIRVLWGRTPPAVLDDAALVQFQADLQQAAPHLTIAVTLMADFALYPAKFSWNHSKIVAADGRVSFVSGINMWANDYLTDSPVTDVGVVVQGPAAADSQKFLDVLWRYAYADQGTLPMQTKIVATAGVDLTTILSLAPTPGSPVGDVRVMSVGRAGFIADRFITPGRVSGRNDDNPVTTRDQAVANWWVTSTPMNGPTMVPGRNTWDGNNPSDTALRALVDSAKSSIVVSQQSMEYPQGGGALPYEVDKPCYDVRLFDALARKVRDGIPVTIIVSNIDRRSGDYRANPSWTMHVMLDRLTKLTGSQQAAVSVASRFLRVAPFRYSEAAHWPGQTVGPGLHSKVIEVDGRAVYVGSQNAYPDEQQEFGYIIEDRAAVADFNRLYLGPSVLYSAPGLRPDPLVVATNADAGPGSLRAALLFANQYPGPDRIRFNITAGSTTITLASPLPAITDPVSLDGLSQAGVAIVGSRLRGSGDGFVFTAAAATSSITGLTISGFPGSGLLVAAAGVTVRGNEIVGNGRGLTLAAAADCLIGGAQVADGNTLRANTVGLFAGAACHGTAVEGNLFTRNTTGVFLAHVTGLSLGTAAAGNTISSNATAGVYASGGLSGTIVQNNTIADNGRFGVQLADAVGLQLGGSATNTGNRIATVSQRRSRATGVYATGDATGTFVVGNTISGNSGNGMTIQAARGITIGGPAANDGNAIAANAGFGIRASGVCTGAIIQGNAISGNRLGGINKAGATGLTVR